MTGADSASGEMRTFRLDRVTRVAVSDGVFDVPTGFDPAAQVLAGTDLTVNVVHCSVNGVARK